MEKKQAQVLTARFDKLAYPTDIASYHEHSGYEGLKNAIHMDKEKLLDELDIAHLRGRGGAAYPLGEKWRHLFHSKGETKYIVCNADEGEPGTFKDKALLEKDPFAVIEGMTIAGYLFGVHQGYIYIHGEYRSLQKRFQEALDQARKHNLLGEKILGVSEFNYDIKIISGAGAYVCGENSALLNSIEGKTGRPRVKPPHLADVGLYLQPTLVNNVESFASIPVILRIGGQAFFDLGTADGGGTGTNRPLKFAHFGGQSGPIGDLAKLEDCLYSYEDLWAHDLSIGCGAIVVLDESVSLVDYLTSVASFFAHESCGKCTPCRIGTLRILEMIQKFQKKEAQPGDLTVLESMMVHVTRLSACGLGQSAATAIQTGLRLFQEDFTAAIDRHKDAAKEVLWL